MMFGLTTDDADLTDQICVDPLNPPDPWSISR